MRIGINALFLIPGKVGGSEIYLRNLLSALQVVDRKNEYVVFTNRENQGTFKLENNFREYPCPVRALIRPHRILWEQVVLPYRVRQLNLDLLHGPGFISPLFCPCPSVVTILDLIYLRFPETFPRLARLGMNFLVANSARRSAAIITLSRYSQDEVMWEFDIPWDKSSVIYLGVSQLRGGGIPRRERLKVLQRYGIVLPFILSVAAAHPHKNLVRLLEAFYQLKTKGERYQLVVVGAKHNQYFKKLQKVITRLEIGRDVLFTDWVPGQDKEILYVEARLMVFPSLLEGFGLPVLEGMKAGVPVACSDVPSLDEVAGEAAYRFNPHSVEEITRAMEDCLTRPELREELIEKGRRQAAPFTWEKTARETVTLYQKVLDNIYFKEKL